MSDELIFHPVYVRNIYNTHHSEKISTQEEKETN